jgi:hypothetical protein
MPCDADGEPMGNEAPTTDGETVQVNGECCRTAAGRETAKVIMDGRRHP